MDLTCIETASKFLESQTCCKQKLGILTNEAKRQTLTLKLPQHLWWKMEWVINIDYVSFCEGLANQRCTLGSAIMAFIGTEETRESSQTVQWVNQTELQIGNVHSHLDKSA